MAQTESLGDVIEKNVKKSLLAFMKLVDPACKFSFDKNLIEAWNRLSLNEQRRLYLYLKYKKWRGEELFGTPFEIISNCHPYPTNWNGRMMLNTLMKTNKMVIAKHNGSFGTYTLDEARVWEMTDVKPLNF